MDKLSSYESVLNQSVIMQLHLVLKSLDLLEHSIAAAHVDAAIQSMKNTTSMDCDSTIFDASFQTAKTKMDVSGGKYTLTQTCNGEDFTNPAFIEIGMEI